MAGTGGLIHMNGRVQDSVTGRFISPDPYVTEPGNTQGYNRYAYVRNNPLSYIDPSGFSISCSTDISWDSYYNYASGGNISTYEHRAGELDLVTAVQQRIPVPHMVTAVRCQYTPDYLPPPVNTPIEVPGGGSGSDTQGPQSPSQLLQCMKGTDVSSGISIDASAALSLADATLGSAGAAALSIGTTSRTGQLAELGGIAGQGSSYKDRVRAGAAIAGAASRAVPGLNTAAAVVGMTAMVVQAKNDLDGGVDPAVSLGSMGFDYAVGSALASAGPPGWVGLGLYTAAGGSRGIARGMGPLARAETCNALYGSPAIFIP